LFIIAIFVVLIGVGISNIVPKLMGILGAEAAILSFCFILGSITQAINIFNNGIVALSRGIQKTLSVNIIEIIASLLGFLTTFVLIVTDYGLWSIAVGLLIRALVKLIGNSIFSLYTFRGTSKGFLGLKRSRVKEFLVMSPATTLGGISHAVRENSDVALVAIIISPEIATVLSLTKKALQLIQSFVDMIPFAVYGSFANIITSDQKNKTMQVYHEIHSLRFSVAIIMASAYMAINHSLVSLWIGNDQFGGTLLTIFLGIQFIIGGSSFLANYLYRATGQVMQGSLLLFAESTIQILFMIALSSVFGLPGIALSGIIAGSIFGWVSHRLMTEEVKAISLSLESSSIIVWLIRVVLLSVGAVTGIYIFLDSWFKVIGVGLIIVILGGLTLFFIDPLMGNIKISIIDYYRQLRDKIYSLS